MSEKWWDMSDDELDDLFREASDKAEIPFDSSALNKLRQKIDFKPSPEPQQGFKKRWLALIALLFFVGVALLYTFSDKKEIILPSSTIKNNQENRQPFPTESSDNKQLNQEKLKEVLANKVSKIDEKKVADKPSLKVEAKSINNEKVVKESVENKVFTSSAKSNNISGKTKSLAFSNDKNILNQTSISALSKSEIQEKNVHNNLVLDKAEKANPTNGSEALTNGLITNENSIFVGKAKKSGNRKTKLKDFISHSELIDYQNNTIISTPIIPIEEKPIEQETILKTDFNDVNFLSNKGTKPLETHVESESPTYVDAPPIMMKQPKFSRFGVRLAIAPEINSIERMETSAVVGSMFALLLEYRLTKKLTLQTGINYSKKKYKGDFEYYRAWTNGAATKPLTVDGICSVVDIPINLRLNAFQTNRNTFFISGGVSSYLMSDEVYIYNYASGPPKIRNWTGNSSSFYWSTLNLSAGIERKMTKHFTLQVEPFMKTPLMGVGRGLVNLYSSGLLFSTKYEF